MSTRMGLPSIEAPFLASAASAPALSENSTWPKPLDFIGDIKKIQFECERVIEGISYLSCELGDVSVGNGTTFSEELAEILRVSAEGDVSNEDSSRLLVNDSGRLFNLRLGVVDDDVASLEVDAGSVNGFLCRLFGLEVDEGNSSRSAVRSSEELHALDCAEIRIHKGADFVLISTEDESLHNDLVHCTI